MLKLKYKSDRKTLAAVTLYFVSTGLIWYYFPQLHIALQIFAVIFLCMLSFICAVIVHNTVHVPIFRSKRANKVFQIVLSMTYGYPVSPFVIGHNLSHHQHTGKDQDIARTDKLRFKWNFLNQALFFFVTSDSIMKSEWLWIKKMWKEDRRSWVIQYFLELIGVGLIKIPLLFFNWPVTLLTIWLPHLWAQWGIVGTNFWQHDGCDVYHEYNHSRNFTNKLLNFLVFNNGYHGLHHNNATLHWSELPEIYEKEFAPNIHPNLNRNSLFMYLWESCGWPGKRLDYLGNPVVLDKNKQEDSLEWINHKDYKKNIEHLGAEV
ncbi:fatty acid desaturase family protein [Marinoscillum pacificum]|uniref:fatty acid desaturase family protein n=1 Tax=Marinoscillum pacificum TaxID=392723 RepID=UPI002157B59C|nr:fatty acid desaturase [Marinoscillum pacificum]